MSGKDLAEVCGVARFEECAAELTDPRGMRGRCYPLSVFVAVALAGLLCGRNTPLEWARWAGEAPEVVVRALGGIGIEVGGVSWWSLPSYNRLVEVLSGLDPVELARFASRIVPVAEGEATDLVRQVRSDGKRPVGAGRGTGDGSKLIVVGALADRGGLGGQTMTDEGEEIAALRALCEGLDVEGALVSADALHCNEGTAQAVLDAGADYCLSLKGNRPLLHTLAKHLPWNEVDNAHTSRERGHERSQMRTVKVLAAGGAVRLDFPGLTQIARTRHWTRDEATGEVNHHVMFYLTSRNTRALQPAEFAEAIRGHWGIEPAHGTREVAFGQDRSTTPAGNLAANLASLHGAAIAILKRLDTAKAKDSNDVTAWNDHLSNHPYTTPLEILGITHDKQELQACLPHESRALPLRSRPRTGLVCVAGPVGPGVRAAATTRCGAGPGWRSAFCGGWARVFWRRQRVGRRPGVAFRGRVRWGWGSGGGDKRVGGEPGLVFVVGLGWWRGGGCDLGI
ncbi:ISAs1 family transposase [Glycomyces sp. NPDC046736]|uniref:ISAs1 family transposase n=1 Tax=Glycomyces sp. NPDC046736 TaxID=3155615 RepID=UPI0033EE29FA